MVKYIYDAWGNCSVNVIDSTATTVANPNPFRYRSYYYDTETNLYFLKTRYYDPEVGRFMTIDGVSYLNPDSINGLNLYAYCLNNPVAYSDETGCSVVWLIVSAVVIGLCTIAGAVWGYNWSKRVESNMDIGNTQPELYPEINNLPNDSQNKIELPEEATKDEITVGDRIANAFIGALAGLAVGGFIVMGVALSLGLLHVISIITAEQLLALGSLATVIGAGLLLGFGIDFPSFDYESTNPYSPDKPDQYNHPAWK